MLVVQRQVGRRPLIALLLEALGLTDIWRASERASEWSMRLPFPQQQQQQERDQAARGEGTHCWSVDVVRALCVWKRLHRADPRP